MNPPQKEKLNLLIRTSAVLSDVERAEWLGLLDLMNDKQLGELEKILQAGIGAKNEITNNKLPISSGQTGKEMLNPKPQMPGLSHIMNLPKISAQTLAPMAKITNLPHAASNVPPNKPVFTFGQKLQAMVSEKELPAGNPKYELKLSDGKKIESPAAAPKAAFAVPAPLPKMAMPKFPAPVSPVFKPGLNFGKESEKIKSLLTPPTPPANLRPAAIATPSRPFEGTHGNFEKPEDLLTFNAKMLNDTNFEGLLKSLKLLIQKFGYHTVLFSLEQSPLYKDYINTGQQSLVQQASFEQLGATGNYLNRQIFEKFADLLSQMQSS